MFVVMLAALSWVVSRDPAAWARRWPSPGAGPGSTATDERRVTFDDVAGIDEAVAELREVVEFLRTPEKYQPLGGRIPKGVLLVGPPGTGKTLLAQAVAGEAGVPFFSLSGSDFVEMFVGVGAARVRSLFAQAEAKAPCLIFIDELDAIGKARGRRGRAATTSATRRSTSSSSRWTGSTPTAGSSCWPPPTAPRRSTPPSSAPAGSTARSSSTGPTSPAASRSSRSTPGPSRSTTTINLRQIAAMTPGFVGADLANLVNEAALLAARKGQEPRSASPSSRRASSASSPAPRRSSGVLRREEKRADRLPRGRPRPGRPQPARDRPGPQGLDPRPRQRRARLHDVSPRGRPLPPHPDLAREHDLQPAGRHARRGARLRRGLRRLHQRPPARHPDRPPDGRRVRHEPALGRVSYQNEGRARPAAGGAGRRPGASRPPARSTWKSAGSSTRPRPRARAILDRPPATLERIAALLIERETIDADELRRDPRRRGSR